MSAPQTAKPKRADADKRTVARLFLLDLAGGRVISLNPDGSDKRVIASDCHWPDGVAVDVRAGNVYWTNTGNPKQNDGTIERANLDGSNRKTIVPSGVTFTPKQLHLDEQNEKLYWCDREGMRVMRANLDGSSVETLVDSSGGDPRPGPDATKWCVGLSLDLIRRQIYPDAGKVAARPELTPMPLPTIPGNLEEIQSTVIRIARKLDQLPLDRIGTHLDSALSNASTALVDVDTLTRNIDTGVAPEMRSAFAQATTTLKQTEHFVGPDALLQNDLRSTLRSIGRAADSVRVFADYLDNHPEALVRGKVKEP